MVDIKKMVLAPLPCSIRQNGMEYKMPGQWQISLPERLCGLEPALYSLWPGIRMDTGKEDICFLFDGTLPKEAYCLNIDSDRIVIAYGSGEGAFYAMATLHQMVLQSDGVLSGCEIRDRPQLALRGALLDISRGKVPRLESLKKLVDLLASLKYNHLELYIEGFSFGYPSFPGVWREEACLTQKELAGLSRYCAKRFIELVPHQNSLGHMTPWLARPEYGKLAEGKEGLSVMGMHFPPTTLDAAEPESFELVKRLMEDLLPAFGQQEHQGHTPSAGWFHTGLDEPFELRKEKILPVVLPYIRRLYAFLKENGRKMIMWDDLLLKEPKLGEALPEDILVMDWGYDGEFPVETRAAELKKNGHPFALCPGTSSWSSFTGLTDNMMRNIRRTAEAAYRYGAYGMMVTDWGDMNHLQYQPVSYAGFVYAAAYAWNPDGISEEELKRALNRFIFRDAGEAMGGFCLAAGRFYLREEFRLPCRSLACLPLMFGKCPKEEFERKTKQLAESVTFFSPAEVCNAYLLSYRKRKAFAAGQMYGFLQQQLSALENAAPACEEGRLAVKEYRNAICMLEYLTMVREEILCGRENARKRDAEEVLEEHKKLWMERNKKSGMEAGIRMFEKMF